jgi:protease II
MCSISLVRRPLTVSVFRLQSSTARACGIPEVIQGLILGYGAYGLSLRATFTQSAFSLIDRGFVYAIAHVRGGHEKGEGWYEQGRMLNKRNTFTDFIAVTETLIAKGYADSRAIFAQGGSAGGLLMGAIANLRPDLYAGIVAEVPFVDIVTTMSDASAPLTTLEYNEWGNPAVKPEYDYMLVLFTLRQCRAKELSADVRYRRLLRQPGELCRTRQVDRKAEGEQD